MAKRFIGSFALLIALPLLVSGCVSTPKGFLKIPEDHLEKRTLQSRQYDSNDTANILAASAGVLGTLTARVVAVLGLFMLALVFQNLANPKPGIDAGSFTYAKEGFGDFHIFLSAFGYWSSACVGNVF